MIVERVEDTKWLANAWLVADEPGGHGVLIDGNGAVEPLLDRVGRDRIAITHVLLTHHHPDHVVDLARYRSAFPAATVVAHPVTSSVLPAGAVDRRAGHGDRVVTGNLAFTAIDTPGHCQGHLAWLLNGADLFSGDVLFRRTVGGHARPGGRFPELRRSVMALMELPDHVRVRPGHRGETTIGEERHLNLFVRHWRGIDPAGDEPVLVAGRGAGTLLVWAPDYDGGHKGLVRLADGTEGVFFGSRITRSA